MKRTTVKIPDELDSRVRHEAERRGITLSELVREALEAHVGDGPPKRRHLDAVGVLRGGPGDISTRVEEIIYGKPPGEAER